MNHALKNIIFIWVLIALITSCSTSPEERRYHSQMQLYYKHQFKRDTLIDEIRNTTRFLKIRTGNCRATSRKSIVFAGGFQNNAIRLLRNGTLVFAGNITTENMTGVAEEINFDDFQSYLLIIDHKDSIILSPTKLFPYFIVSKMIQSGMLVVSNGNCPPMFK